MIVSTKNEFESIDNRASAEILFAEIIDEFNELYKEILMFYSCWSAKIQGEGITDDDTVVSMVEAQCMYSVRGNRYQVFELEPLRKLLPPHDAILKELFGVSAEEVVQGLEKLQYSLS